MTTDKLPDWFPEQPPIYDIKKSYADNALHGPFFSGTIPKRVVPPKEKWIDFLGFRVASPIGIPAGPLLTSSWVSLAAKLGYDIAVYKTIRSREHPAHPVPNMIYVETKGSVAHVRSEPTSEIDQLAVTNSFGMPSMSRSFLMEDIGRAKCSLSKGQILVVSVVGTPRTENTFIEDFVDAALLAKEAGAEIIEANFSCPNVDKKEGILYLSPEGVREIATALVNVLGEVPLILKMGVFPDRSLMRSVFLSAARAGVRAICGINTVSMRVTPPLSPDRPTSGICGGPIRNDALHFLRDAADINRKEKLDLTLMGCGGITRPEHFDHFLQAGAQIGMTATGMIWDPYLALRYHAGHL